MEAAKNLSEEFKRFQPGSEQAPPSPEGAAGAPAATETEEDHDFHFQNFGIRKDLPRDFKFDLETARNFDDDNIMRAKQGVREILADAMNNIKAKAEEIKTHSFQEGRESGYQNGFREGEDAARNEFLPFMKTLENLVEELSLFRKNMYSKVEREMVQMVIGLAKKIIQTDLESRKDSIRDIIQLAVGSILDRESLIIKVSPQDHKYIEHYSPILQSMYPDINNVRFEASPAIERGGCLVQSNFGSVEANMESLNNEIADMLDIAPHKPEEKLGEELDEEHTAGITPEEDPAPEEPETPSEPGLKYPNADDLKGLQNPETDPDN